MTYPAPMAPAFPAPIDLALLRRNPTDLYPGLRNFRYPEPVSLVHAILGVRASPNLLVGRADSQDRMDLKTPWQREVNKW